MLRALKWLGTTAGIAGAILVALNIPASGWGFALFLVSSVSWGAAGVMMGEASLVTLQAAFTAINILGGYRWLLA